MSYILDALRRADAERERGAVPGIHALPEPPPAADELVRRPRGLGLGLVVVVVLALVVLLGFAVWWWSRAPESAAPANVPVTAAPEPAPAVPEPSPAATPPTVALPAPIERRPTRSEAEAAAAAAAASAAAAPKVVARHELPEELRRQLPPLTVSGSMYSPDPASRFLIINGQMLHEKGEIGPDHVLVQIKLRAAVLRFKGTLYEITF